MIIVTKLNRNGGQLSELDGTEWLYPPGAPSTRRAPQMGLAGVNTGFLILTGIDKMVSKIKAFLDLYEHSLTAVYTANLCS